MRCPDGKHWIVAFDTAALHVLARRPDLADPRAYSLRAEPCPEHGPACVRVVYGALVDHFSCTGTDPAEVAASLLRSMLPPALPGSFRRARVVPRTLLPDRVPVGH